MGSDTTPPADWEFAEIERHAAAKFVFQFVVWARDRVQADLRRLEEDAGQELPHYRAMVTRLFDAKTPLPLRLGTTDPADEPEPFDRSKLAQHKGGKKKTIHADPRTQTEE